MFQTISQFIVKTTMYYGSGSTKLTGTEAGKLGITKALIVTDQGVRNAGLLKHVEESLAENKVASEVFDGVEEDADVNMVHRIASRIKEVGCDGVIVVGGGSPICAAKGASLEATNEVADVRAFEGSNEYDVPPLPVVCVPTTAGSGSDVSDGFPIVDYDKHRHFGIRGDHITPPVTILDPLLLETCPLKPMTYAGIDALSHALEALWGARATILTDALAYEAIRLIMTNLKEATFTHNLEAKLNQHLGSTLAMLASGNAGLGIVHAFAGVIFSFKGAHGYKCGVVLPFAMEFNMPVCEEKFAKMATILGESSYGKTTPELARLFLYHVKQLLVDLEFPRKFEQVSMSQEKTAEVIEEIKKMSPSFTRSNLRKVTDEDIVSIFEASLRGWELE